MLQNLANSSFTFWTSLTCSVDRQLPYALRVLDVDPKYCPATFPLPFHQDRRSYSIRALLAKDPLIRR